MPGATFGNQLPSVTEPVPLARTRHLSLRLPAVAFHQTLPDIPPTPSFGRQTPMLVATPRQRSFVVTRKLPSPTWSRASNRSVLSLVDDDLAQPAFVTGAEMPSVTLRQMVGRAIEAQGLSPSVKLTDAVLRLHQALQSASVGSQAVILHGRPGSGKSTVWQTLMLALSPALPSITMAQYRLGIAEDRQSVLDVVSTFLPYKPTHVTAAYAVADALPAASYWQSHMHGYHELARVRKLFLGAGVCVCVCVCVCVLR